MLKMKCNKLGFLSFIALLGILGLITENKGFFGFFGYLYYLRYFTVIPDELFMDNVRKAGSIAFFTGIAVSAVSIAVSTISGSLILSTLCFTIGFIVSMFAFTITLLYLEYKEQRGI